MEEINVEPVPLEVHLDESSDASTAEAEFGDGNEENDDPTVATARTIGTTITINSGTTSASGSKKKKRKKKHKADDEKNAKVHWCYTLNNYTEEEIKLIRDHDGKSFAYHIFGREVGGDNGTPHLQGYFQLHKKKRLGGVKKLLGINRIHLESMRGTPQEASDYCEKDDKSPHRFGNLAASRKRDPFKPFMDVVKSGVRHMPILREKFPSLTARHHNWCELYCQDNGPKPDPTILETLRPWQEELSRELRQPADNRTIFVVVDEEGGAGKSEFTYHWIDSEDSNAQSIQMGKHENMYYMFTQFEFLPETIFFDSTRAGDEYFSYQPLENIKNGRFTSTKYRPRQIRLPVRPHIVVMTNSFPNFADLSVDRWKVMVIDSSLTDGYYYLTADDIKGRYDTAIQAKKDEKARKSKKRPLVSQAEPDS